MSRPFLCSHVGHWQHFPPKPFKHSRPTRRTGEHKIHRIRWFYGTALPNFSVLLFMGCWRNIWQLKEIFLCQATPTRILRNDPKRIVLSQDKGTRAGLWNVVVFRFYNQAFATATKQHNQETKLRLTHFLTRHATKLHNHCRLEKRCELLFHSQFP